MTYPYIYPYPRYIIELMSEYNMNYNETIRLAQQIIDLQKRSNRYSFNDLKKNESRQYVDAMDEVIETLRYLKNVSENPELICFNTPENLQRHIDSSERSGHHISAAILRFELNRLENKK